VRGKLPSEKNKTSMEKTGKRDRFFISNKQEVSAIMILSLGVE
jgi:hypothetical protein